MTERRPAEHDNRFSTVPGRSPGHRVRNWGPGFPPLAAPAAGPDADAGDHDRFVIHLSVEVPDLAAAQRLARQLCAALAYLRELDPTATTVSFADGQHDQIPVFCGRRLGDGSRCTQEPGHG